MTRRALSLAAMFTSAVALGIGSHAQQAATNPEWAITIEPLQSPAGANSTEPQMTTVTGAGGRTVLSWLEVAGSHATLKFVERTASGWSGAQAAAEGNDFMVNAADVPAVGILADGSFAAAWLRQDGADPESYTLELSMSHDGGRTWTRPVRPHHDSTHTQHGFASL